MECADFSDRSAAEPLHHDRHCNTITSFSLVSVVVLHMLYASFSEQDYRGRKTLHMLTLSRSQET